MCGRVLGRRNGNREEEILEPCCFCAKHLTYFNSFNPQKNKTKKPPASTIIVIPNLQVKKRRVKGLDDLPKSLLINGRVEFKPRQSKLRSLNA